MDKFIEFVKKHAGFLSALLAAVLLGLPLWFAVFGEHADAVVKLLEVVAAPVVLGVGFAAWFVVKFEDDIRLLMRRLKRIGEVELSEEEAEDVKWLRRTAEQGDAEAQFNLGRMYRKGEGVPQDNKEAVKWFRLAAEQGHARAQNNLGVRYRRGEGVPQDYAKAAKWYRRAAEQGHAQAQFNLGERYREGKGVPQDDAEAAKWYRRAAGQGYAKAEGALDLLRQGGDGEK